MISASGRVMGSKLLQIATGDANAVANTGAFTGRMSLDDSPRKKVEAWCLAHTVDEIVTALVEADIPVAPVKTIPQVAEDPHLWEREMLVKMEDPVAGEMYLPGATIKMSKTPGRIGPGPHPGPAHRRGPFQHPRLRPRHPRRIAGGEGHRLIAVRLPMALCVPILKGRRR